MKKLKLILIIICWFFLSCNGTTNSTGGDTSNNSEDNFSGTWLYLNQIPKVPNKDASMDGSLCKIHLMEGAKESYSVDVLNYTDISFSKENDSTLKSVSSDVIIKYVATTQHILFLYSSDKMDGMEFSKMK